MEPKSTKMALQKDVQKMITNLSCRLTQEHASRGVGGPLKEFIQDPGPPGPRATRGQGAEGRGQGAGAPITLSR